jgi:hypothetical protein
MSEMIEQVAKAMWDARRAHANNAGIFLEFWGDGTIPIANGIMDEARAAIEAMRQPTSQMQRAGWVKLREKNDIQTRLGNSLVGVETPVYEAMIDAALS